MSIGRLGSLMSNFDGSLMSNFDGSLMSNFDGSLMSNFDGSLMSNFDGSLMFIGLSKFSSPGLHSHSSSSSSLGLSGSTIFFSQIVRYLSISMSSLPQV